MIDRLKALTHTDLAGMARVVSVGSDTPETETQTITREEQAILKAVLLEMSKRLTEVTTDEN